MSLKSYTRTILRHWVKQDSASWHCQLIICVPKFILNSSWRSRILNVRICSGRFDVWVGKFVNI